MDYFAFISGLCLGAAPAYWFGVWRQWRAEVATRARWRADCNAQLAASREYWNTAYAFREDAREEREVAAVDRKAAEIERKLARADRVAALTLRDQAAADVDAANTLARQEVYILLTAPGEHQHN